MKMIVYVNFQSAGKVKKNDGDPQNENASTHKEKKPAISMFPVHFLFLNIILLLFNQIS